MFVTSTFDGRLTRVSPSVTRLLGYSREEFLARPFLEQIHPDDVERTLASVAQQERGQEGPELPEPLSRQGRVLPAGSSGPRDPISRRAGE